MSKFLGPIFFGPKLFRLNVFNPQLFWNIFFGTGHFFYPNFSFQAADIIKANHNGKYTPLFVLDHSPIHSAMADDALNARKMNVNPGGRQPLMRPGWYEKDGVRVSQSMVFEDGRYTGLAKGLKAVCEERFGADLVKGV